MRADGDAPPAAVSSTVPKSRWDLTPPVLRSECLAAYPAASGGAQDSRTTSDVASSTRVLSRVSSATIRSSILAARAAHAATYPASALKLLIDRV
jgi:hypothetical protein